MDLLTLSLQLGLSAVLGSIIGLERNSLHKAAGYRTLSMVAVGVTLFTQLSQYGFTSATAGAIDPTRIAAQVVTGIGFLGAGLIIFHKERIHNLTTAAAVWSVAAIGMAVGVGWYWPAIVASIIALLILHVSRWIIPQKIDDV